MDALLAHERSAEGFLGSPLGGLAANVLKTARHRWSVVGSAAMNVPPWARAAWGGYRARDTQLGREVAIEVLPPVFVADRERLARFEREARVLAA